MSQSLDDVKLIYKPSINQGQCTLQQIHPIQRSTWRFILYLILSLCTGGLFALIVYWYPQFQRILIYNSCSLQESTHFFIRNYDNQYTIAERTNEVYHPNQSQSHNAIGFINRYMKYIIMNGVIKAIDFEYRKRISNIFKNPNQGFNNLTAQKMRQCYGPGTMIIQRPNIVVLFGRQVFRPLYLFIVFSICLWSYEAYYYYAGVIFVTSTVSIAINLYQIHQLNQKIFHMAYYDIPLHVLRQNTVIQISSVDIVPGDIVFLKQAIKLPFEGIILEGSALINQCALTGESVPIVKKADVKQKYQSENIQLDKSAYIFQGTTIVQVNMKKKMNKFQVFRQAFGIPVCVIRTNFITLKGQLIRIISFPKQQQNQFQKQSSRFLIFLFCLSVASYCILIIKLHNIASVEDMIVKFLDLITITVPPGLPVSMTFGIIFALQKLKSKQIFCISPNKIISGGRVNHACFDKTGTLTQDFMDFYGLVPCKQKIFYPLIESIQNKQGVQRLKIQDIIDKKPYIKTALSNMASNHSIIQIQNTGELIGDPMEIKLFEFGDFQLDFSQNNPDVVFSYQSKRHHKGVIYRRFEFDSDVQRMSVIASNSQLNNQIYCYCKGSPQIMLQIMNKASVPDQYHQTLKQYASRGFRVLAIGSKKMTINPKDILRHDAESQLMFDGFQVFENKLKPETYNAIQDLKRAQISCVMITGDNPLTGSNIAYKCQIAFLQKNLLICDFKNGNFFQQQFSYHEHEVNHKKKKQYIEKRKNQGNFIDEHLPQNIEMNSIKKGSKVTNLYEAGTIVPQTLQTTLTPTVDAIKDTKTQDFMKKLINRAQKQNYQLCLTGSAFNELIGTHIDNIDELRIKFINKATVYARTKPNDKARIVTMYQNLGNVVVMCGDGANDCGALKQADVGLSLSQAQASISAPFTSKIINISAVVQLIKQCRAGLATNFSLFNIMALYSLIQYTSTIIAQFYYAYPSDFQYLYWDLAGNFFFFLTFGNTGTLPFLSRHVPNNSLFCFTNIFQVVFMFIIQLIGQICMILALNGQLGINIDYENNGGQSVNKQKYLEEQDFIKDTPQTNIIFVFTNFMYIFSLLAFSISKPWRKQFWTNFPFMIVLFIVFTYSVLLAVVPDARLNLFEVSWMISQKLNGFVLGIALLFSFFIYGVQKFILQPGTVWIRQKYPQKAWL